MVRYLLFLCRNGEIFYFHSVQSEIFTFLCTESETFTFTLYSEIITFYTVNTLRYLLLLHINSEIFTYILYRW